jgi:hypothetical protein
MGLSLDVAFAIGLVTACGRNSVPAVDSIRLNGIDLHLGLYAPQCSIGNQNES